MESAIANDAVSSATNSNMNKSILSTETDLWLCQLSPPTVALAFVGAFFNLSIVIVLVYEQNRPGIKKSKQGFFARIQLITLALSDFVFVFSYCIFPFSWVKLVGPMSSVALRNWRYCSIFAGSFNQCLTLVITCFRAKAVSIISGAQTALRMTGKAMFCRLIGYSLGLTIVLLGSIVIL